VTVLDAQAVVALLVGESAADEVAALLKRADTSCYLSTANLAEVVDVLVRLGGNPPERVEEKLDWLIAGGLRLVDVTDHLARRAGRIRSEYYHRTHSHPTSTSS